MSWMLYAFYCIITSLMLFILHGNRRNYLQRGSRAEIWSKLNIVGVSPAYRHSFLRAVLVSIISTRELANEGYRKFSKGLDRPYGLPTPWVRGGAVVVLPPSRVPLLARPDKMGDGEWTNLGGLIETTQLPYIVDDANVYHNVLHFETLRRKMGPRDMARLAPVTAEEIDLAFREVWGTEEKQKTINGWEACSRIMSRASSRVLFGLPLSRDETLLETSRQYANSLLVGGAIINCFPPATRWLVAPLVALRARYFQARFVKILVPRIEERLRRWKGDKNDEGPDDFLQWMIPICAKDPDPRQLDPTRVALRLVSLLTPLIFATCYVFAHCVLDIHGSADKVAVLASLRGECERVASQHSSGLYNDSGCLFATGTAVDALHRVDSALRESMRVSDVAVTNLFRDVTTGTVDVGGGLRVGPGVRIAFPTQNIHMDPDHYEDPQRYDALRFSRPFEAAAADGEAGADPLGVAGRRREHITTTSPTFLPFGYGRHACPGRWFAAQMMKQALAYLLMHYDVELEGAPIQRRALLNTMVPPVHAQIQIRRRA
ncbi:P450 monooxygenase [Apiospora arundinis]